MRKQWLVAGVFAVLFSMVNAGCSSDIPQATNSSKLNANENSQVFFSTSQLVNVEVAYEPNAEPFTGNTERGRPFWDITEENIKAIYAERPQTPLIYVPKTLEEMNAIPAQNKSSWTVDDIVDLAQEYRQGTSSTQNSYFWVVFLKGNYSEDGTINTSVVGVNIDQSSIIAIFKDVVKATDSNPNGAIPKYIEQSTVVHELGHAFGLVNNGIPMTSEHQDVEHGKHCSNPDCVMNWQNEGSTNLKKFVQNIITTGNLTLFGSECLDDVHAYNP